MASLCRDKNGTRRIVVKVNGRRRPIRLGRMPIRIALTFKARVDILEYALASNTTPDPETAAWAARLSPELFEKLESLGLVPPRPRQEGDAGEPRGPTLGAFLAEHVERRIDVKPATKEVESTADTPGEAFEVATGGNTGDIQGIGNPRTAEA